MTQNHPVIGLVHPGAMGASVGGALTNVGHDVVWASAGRSNETNARAVADGLRDVGDLGGLVEVSDVIVSVCPPAAALAMATDIAARQFSGIYVDANAISPATSRTIGQTVAEAGATYVDGGIIGPPVRTAGSTVLYLSGAVAACAEVEHRFADTLVDVQIAGTEPGAASAVKMAFAAWTKGTSALLLAIRALAESEGVVHGLDHAWSVLAPDLPARLRATAAATGPKAWRFVGEMEQIADTFAGADLPRGFHDAAATIYGRLADLKGADDITADDVIRRLVDDHPSSENAGVPE